MLKRLRERENEADLYAMAGDFSGACCILRGVINDLREIYGFGDPYKLRKKARQDLGHWA